MSRRPEFTPKQIDWICYQIGDWYLDWKHRIVCDGGGHRLGVAKELLKEKICGDGSIEEYYRLYRINFYQDNDTQWRFKITHPELGFQLENRMNRYENCAEAFKQATKAIDAMAGDCKESECS